MRFLPSFSTLARTKHGFSLVELSIVIAILGVVATFGLQAAANLANRTATSVSRERIVLVDDAVARFFKIYGRLPCPALKTTAPETITYGLEDCSNGLLITGTTIGGGLMSGAVPFKTLNLPTMFAIDGFYNKVNYVVTKNLTAAGGDVGAAPIYTGRFATKTDISSDANDGIAGIEIRSGVLEQPCSTTKCQVLADPAVRTGAAYVLFSSGADQRGALSDRGIARSSCAPAVAINDRRVDTQNCVFGSNTIRGYMNVGGIASSIPYNVFYDNRYNAGFNLTSYFDDVVVWRSKAQL
jgi:prepilin-type N-terminal cleavage/methylation domain-containing protein